MNHKTEDILQQSNQQNPKQFSLRYKKSKQGLEV
jgi:hypothetical protein